MKIPIKILCLICLLFFVSELCAQQEIEITYCKEMKKGKLGNLMLLSVIQNDDTLSFPCIGNGKYLNPLNLCNDKIQYDRSDESKVKILFENYKYQYVFKMDKRDLYCPKLKICIDGKKHRKGYFKWSYLNCASIGTSGYIKRKKIKFKTQ